MRPPPATRPAEWASGGGSPSSPSVPELFGVYLDDYFAHFARLSWADLTVHQEGHRASLAYGAAGIAYAHWYAGYLRHDEVLLEQAARWLRAALAGQRHRLAFLGPQALPGHRMPAGTYFLGRIGLSFVGALIARSRGDRRAERRAVSGFAALSRAAPECRLDLYSGSAGCLVAAAILFRHLGGEILHGAGSELAAELARRSVPDGRGKRTWNGLHGFGLAHGEAGVFLALLLWSAADGSPLPPWFAPSLAALVDTAQASPERFTPPPYRSQLCKGVLGAAFLAARAAQILGEPTFLAAARALAALATEQLPGHLDLCCGRAGCAFALSPLATQDPAGPWRKLAQDLALSTLLGNRADWWLTGLLGGEAAIPCLALNLALGIDSGPPGFDFIPARAALPLPTC